MIAVGEAFVLGERLGLAHQALFDVAAGLQDSAGRSPPIARCPDRYRPARPITTTSRDLPAR